VSLHKGRSRCSFRGLFRRSFRGSFRCSFCRSFWPFVSLFLLSFVCTISNFRGFLDTRFSCVFFRSFV
jgi:hypothetical protein